ncbi:hypothetical protein [Sphingomonas sp.]|jgi:hypothetical protein|uniref:hypothetical protein n=2 Tax=unclassified Sphingomonas TaxID=196159 RepID=UPI0025D5142F|nr:hypothetical protein [Sphingomonas sp.]
MPAILNGMKLSVTRLTLLAALAIPGAAASARPLATTQIVSCGGGDCLLVRGHRASTASRIRINDRLIAPTGGRAWSVQVPVATLRGWSAPFARSIHVAVVDPAGTVERSDTVRLPVGMLGHDVELASLVVRAH